MQDELLTPPEAAQYLRWTLPTVYTKVSRRQIAFVKIGRSLRFRRSDLDKLIKAGLRPVLRPLSAPVSEEGGEQ